MSNKFRNRFNRKKDKDPTDYFSNIYFHFVYNEDDTLLWCHSHGMEKYGLKNITMYAPDKSWADFCNQVLNMVCIMMTHGETFDLNKYHVIDECEGGPLLHFFFLCESDEEFDDETGESNLEIVYPYEGLDEPVPYNGKNYVFNDYAREWVSIEEMVDHYFKKK